MNFLHQFSVHATQPLFATALYFNTEFYYDWIQIGGVRYSGSTGPVNVQMAAGATSGDCPGFMKKPGRCGVPGRERGLRRN